MENYISWTTQLTITAIRSGIRIALIVLLTVLIFRFIRVVSKKLAAMVNQQKLDLESGKRAETLGLVIRHTLDVLLIVVAIITILSELGIEIGPILAAAGIVGVAVGFGSQSLIKDVINGFFILANDQIRVGDAVQIAGKSGEVEQVSLKMTVLRDASGSVHFIPNSAIDIVTNMTKNYSRYLTDVSVPYEQEVEQAYALIREAGAALMRDPEYAILVREPVEILGVDAFSDFALKIKVRITTEPGKQWKVGREFNRLLKSSFDAHGFAYPFPVQRLYPTITQK
ncbi:MAG TPA: mechanosensitive ion channel family protein [bacterium]|nr:mechanosensitive ion channel family protein [bacterium]